MASQIDPMASEMNDATQSDTLSTIGGELAGSETITQIGVARQKMFSSALDRV